MSTFIAHCFDELFGVFTKAAVDQYPGVTVRKEIGMGTLKPLAQEDGGGWGWALRLFESPRAITVTGYQPSKKEAWDLMMAEAYEQLSETPPHTLEGIRLFGKCIAESSSGKIKEKLFPVLGVNELID